MISSSEMAENPSATNEENYLTNKGLISRRLLFTYNTCSVALRFVFLASCLTELKKDHLRKCNVEHSVEVTRSGKIVI